jgi:hypothetical protein
MREVSIISKNMTENNNQTSTWKKVQSSILMIAAILISIGQWGDTKDVLKSAYSAFVENFTHKVQYKQIDKVNIGNSIAYIKTFLGEPNAVKRSRIVVDVEFYYYIRKKFIFTVITSDKRINGYSVVSRISDFSPEIPFSGPLGESTILEKNSSEFEDSFDNRNLTYYLESQNLGKEKMFLSLSKGFIGYAAVPGSVKVPEKYLATIKTSINTMDSLATYSDNLNELKKEVESLRAMIKPNYYAVSELESKIVAESLLTRFEYQTLTKS